MRALVLALRPVVLAVAVAALSAAGAAIAPPASAVTVGIGDQKPATFSDPRFTALGIHYSRYTVGWDALTSDWQTAELVAWLDQARSAHVDPLISFGHSRTPGERRTLPSPERFRYEFRRFRAMFPWVKTFATWNEANLCGEPTCNRPELVAGYYNAIRSECPSCKILAAEVLDMPNMTSWVKRFRRKARVEPKYWGLHNYLDVNRIRDVGTRRMLKATPPRSFIWLTETGGIVARRNRSTTAGFAESTVHAAVATRWLFDRLVPLSGRIQRVYLYHWSSSTGHDTWDSALVNSLGKARPALAVVKRVVTAQNAKR
ncbi:MAG TPA: hypothetical protein VFB41_03440 [Solirubrobacteraceae bacterium]|nr:hypothetical protein [Solirubrobacteraceae bacterium]